MPLDDEIIEENTLESEEIIEDNPTSDTPNIDDSPVDNNESLVQDEGDLELGSDSLEDEPEIPPSESVEEFIETETGDVSIDGEVENEYPEEYDTYNPESLYSNYQTENIEVYTDLEAFESSTLQVDLYQYTILNRLEFMQYALCIVIALLFLQIFVRYKK